MINGCYIRPPFPVYPIRAKRQRLCFFSDGLYRPAASNDALFQKPQNTRQFFGGLFLRAVTGMAAAIA